MCGSDTCGSDNLGIETSGSWPCGTDGEGRCSVFDGVDGVDDFPGRSRCLDLALGGGCGPGDGGGGGGGGGGDHQPAQPHAASPSHLDAGRHMANCLAARRWHVKPRSLQHKLSQQR
eukprot:1707641-Prymnesium_polylepis.1